MKIHVNYVLEVDAKTANNLFAEAKERGNDYDGCHEKQEVIRRWLIDYGRSVFDIDVLSGSTYVIKRLPTT